MICTSLLALHAFVSFISVHHKLCAIAPPPLIARFNTPSAPQDASFEDIDTVIQTNVNGLLYVTRAVLPGMLQRKSGHIIMLSSIAGTQSYKNGVVYAGSKHAVEGITNCLRKVRCESMELLLCCPLASLTLAFHVL